MADVDLPKLDGILQQLAAHSNETAGIVLALTAVLAYSPGIEQINITKAKAAADSMVLPGPGAEGMAAGVKKGLYLLEMIVSKRAPN
ncbi:MAG: hypothetical protein AB1490_11535 [Pseudomonadota bacterium]